MRCRCFDIRPVIPAIVPVAAIVMLLIAVTLVTVTTLLFLLRTGRFYCHNNAIVMFGMLEKIFRCDPVTGRICIAPQREIFVIDLIRISTYPALGAATVVYLRS